jgi:glucosamine--fructose-6-phosphate aminotransferase (isomerizing)
MTWTPPPPRTGHPYFMHDAIYAQPGALRLVARGNETALAAAAERLRAMDQVILAGIGTSWHAALVGELLLAHAGRLGHRARALHSLEFTHSWPEPDARTGVIVISHRGTKRYSLQALARAKASAGVGVVVTGKGSGDGLAIADVVLRTVEQEASAAHTVSYTCALALLAALAAEIGRDDDIRRALQELPDHLAALLGQESWDALAGRFADRRHYWFVGAGPNAATAYEAALKMNEANHATTTGYESEQFLHGPWAALDPADLVVVVAPPGRTRERGLAAARAARAVGAAVIGLAADDDHEMAALATEHVALPPVPELLSPLVAVVPLQLFTYHLALHRGVNPDTMRLQEPARKEVLAAISL